MEKSKVYFTREITPKSLVKMYKILGREAKGKVAVKISTGEPGGNHYLKPAFIKDLVKLVDGTIVECNTAYGGGRDKTEDHLKVVEAHGFTAIAEVDIMDAEGEMKLPVKDTKHFKYNLVGDHLPRYDFMINLAHFKGHVAAGLGGVLKNQSIGVASSHGKALLHSAGRTEDTRLVWKLEEDQDGFLESMAAAAQSVAEFFGDNILYINVMNNISIDCDCDAHPAPPEIQDIGILSSLDPVALDQACLELIHGVKCDEHNNNKPLLERIAARHGAHTIDYAEQLGMGSKEYELVEVE